MRAIAACLVIAALAYLAGHETRPTRPPWVVCSWTLETDDDGARRWYTDCAGEE